MPRPEPIKMGPSEIALKDRIRRLRRKGIFPGRMPPETLRESHAREIIARKFILPELKKAFLSRVKSVAIIGSAQLGVRKASKKRKGSDLDILVVLERQTYRAYDPELGMPIAEPLKQISEKAYRLFG